jgi:hypothetical protein
MPTNKRMGLHSAEDLLRKLRWEMGEMERKIDKVPNDEVGAYHAFNAAVTAWHICDWVWETAPIGLRERLKCDSPEPSAQGVRLLQALVSEQCRELYICRQLATGAKHFRVDRSNDPAVTTSLETCIDVFESKTSGKLVHCVPGTGVFVNDGVTIYSGLGLFSRALHYWESFFERYGI